MTKRQVSARKIIEATQKTMREGLEDLVKEVLAPSIYEIRLHEEDLARLRPIEDRIVQQIGEVLDDDLKRLERMHRLRGFGRGPRFSSVENRWKVSLVIDPNEELRIGEFDIICDLARLGHEEMHGMRTQVRTKFRENNLETEREEIAADTSGDGVSSQASQRALAAITYEDGTGTHEFLMTRRQIVVGRRDVDSWADLQLEVPTDVAPEHARIRYRSQAGQFEIKDLAGKGTVVDGKGLPWEGDSRKTPWRPLPYEACIELAGGVVLLKFNKTSSKT